MKTIILNKFEVERLLKGEQITTGEERIKMISDEEMEEEIIKSEAEDIPYSILEDMQQ